jgi:signal transduction histidine kinase
MPRTWGVTGRTRRLDPVAVDCVLAATLLVAFEIQAGTAAHGHTRVVQAVTAIPVAVAVAIRRPWTLPALVVAASAVVGRGVLIGAGGGRHGGGLALVAFVLLFYAAGAYLEGRAAVVGLAITLSLGAAIAFAPSGLLAGLFGMVAFVLLPWVVGRSRRRAASREHTVREEAERLDAERDVHVRSAALGERMRLAREVHDVIAHSISVMVIQAAGARTVMDRDPSRAESSLRAVERAGREALAEMRRLLGVLAEGDDPRALEPQPGLDDLPELISRSRAAGLDVSIQVDGEPVSVAPGLSLCAYRVVQEALTNTLKHAGPTRAEVRVHWSEYALELLVTDAGGRGGGTVAEPSGHGIAGMRERTALHGGSVEAGSSPGGGFTVRARIPLLARSVL